MDTKNRFFADFFINELDNLSRKIQEFGQGNESLFGQDTDDDFILSSIQYIAEQWENCVNRKAEEGYPVIDCWTEYRDNNGWE